VRLVCCCCAVLGGPQGTWGVTGQVSSSSKHRHLAARKTASGSSLSDVSDDEDESGDDGAGLSGGGLPVLAASYLVGATRTKQVLNQARRAASLVDLLAQWKDGGCRACAFMNRCGHLPVVCWYEPMFRVLDHKWRVCSGIVGQFSGSFTVAVVAATVPHWYCS
jgi:hypothetical protein